MYEALKTHVVLKKQCFLYKKSLSFINPAINNYIKTKI